MMDEVLVQKPLRCGPLLLKMQSWGSEVLSYLLRPQDQQVAEMAVKYLPFQESRWPSNGGSRTNLLLGLECAIQFVPPEDNILLSHSTKSITKSNRRNGLCSLRLYQ